MKHHISKLTEPHVFKTYIELELAFEMEAAKLHNKYYTFVSKYNLCPYPSSKLTKSWQN